MSGVKILLPDRLGGFAVHVDVERIFSAAFENQVVPGFSDRKREMAVTIFEQ
jgi:hypothetical protein